DKQQLITDLFENITLYDLKAKDVAVKRRADGRYDVTLTVQGAKLYADGKGRERPAPMNERLWVGLFTQKPGTAKFGPPSVLILERRPIRTGLQSLAFVTDRPPKFAGVDP